MNEDDINKISYLDLYEILDISKDNFDLKKIKKNYKKLILRLHPDKTGEDSQAFELVNLAYTILKDNKLKLIYDSKRKMYLQNSYSCRDLNFQILNFRKLCEMVVKCCQTTRQMLMNRSIITSSFLRSALVVLAQILEDIIKSYPNSLKLKILYSRKLIELDESKSI